MLDLIGKENIIFDLGGVLLNIDYNLTSEAFRGLGFEDFDSFYSQQKQTEIFDLFETGKISSEEFLKVLGENIPNVSRRQLAYAWNAMLMDFPLVRLNLLKGLGREFRIFLLSNTNQIHEDAFVKIINDQYGRNVLDEHFEEVHLSHKIGLRKPTKECFDFVLENNGLNPNKTLFIDDSIQHIEGANLVGIDAYHLGRKEDITQLFPDKFLLTSH